MQNNHLIKNLIESEIDKLEKIIDAIPIGIYITTIDGKIILLNNFLVNLLQLPTKDSLKEINLNEYGNFPNILDRKSFIKSLKETGHLENTINEYRTSSGEIIWVNENSSSILDEDGNIKYIIGTIEDITDKIRLETAENYMHQFMNIINDALIQLVENPYMLSSISYSFNLIGTFLNISTIKALFLKQFESFPEYKDFECTVDWHNPNFEVQYDSILFKEILEIFPGIIEDLMSGNNCFFNKDNTNEFQKHILSRLGISSFLCTPIIFGNQFTGLIFFGDNEPDRNWDDGTLKFLSIIGNAIGNHWNNFQNLKKIEELKNTLERIIEASHLGIWEYDLESDILQVNSFFKELMNLSSETNKITYNILISSLSDDYKDYFHRNILEIQNGINPSLNFDFRIDGHQEKYLQMKGKVIEWDNEGKPKRLNGILLDITELKILQNQLQETIRVKDKFFDIIAHDLKNPANAVKSLLDDLLTNFHLFSAEELYEAQSQIQKSISILSQLVNNLLEWSRTQTGRIVFNPDFIDIYYIINNAIDINFSQAQIKNIKITNNVQNNTIVYADSNMLYSIFGNIISNAIKYTKNNGSITIYARDMENFYEFNISDTGIGMSDEQIEHLFSLEHIQSEPGTNQEKGTGLGLIISKEFIERNGGKIYVTSKLNAGTTFSFTLPKSPQQ